MSAMETIDDALATVEPVLCNLKITLAHRELSIVLDEMFEADPQLIPPISRTSSPGRYIVDLPSQHFAVIAEKLG